MKFSLILLLSITISSNLFSYHAADIFQAIWAESYNFDESKNFDYVTLKMKLYDAEGDFDNQLPPKVNNVVGDYFVLYKRKNDLASNVKKMFKDNLMTYDLFSFYFPAIETAYLPKPYVMWDFELSCDGFVKFNIKVFNCIEQAKYFLTDNVNGISTYSTKLIFDPDTSDFILPESVFSGTCNDEMLLTVDLAGFLPIFKNKKIPHVPAGCVSCSLN